MNETPPGMDIPAKTKATMVVELDPGCQQVLNQRAKLLD